MNTEQPENTAPRHKSSAWIVSALAVAAIIIVTLVLAYSAYVKTGRNIKILMTDAIKNFKTGTITHTFRESIADISSTGGDILEVATSLSTESFNNSDPEYILWGKLYLGTTVSEIRVPVTFRYHIQLSDEWRLAARDHVCIVLAPPIYPSLPPAIHTDQMETSTTSGWALFNKSENLAKLEASITPDLEKRAGDSKHIKLVREACRQSVASFVKKWLMKEDYWRSDGFSSIVVVFPDEAPVVQSDQELEQFRYTPTIKLN